MTLLYGITAFKGYERQYFCMKIYNLHAAVQPCLYQNEQIVI
jgi:hypothetical protein